MSAIPLHPDAIQLGTALPFAASEGGPLITMSKSALAHWRGNENDDYGRACDVLFALIDVGPTRALVLENPDSGAFIPRPDGVLIVRWVGAHSTEALITAALAIPASSYEPIEGELPHDGGALVMFDAVDSGSSLTPDTTVEIDLPAGRYAASVCVHWECVVDPGGDVMVQAIMLRRLP